MAIWQLLQPVYIMASVLVFSENKNKYQLAFKVSCKYLFVIQKGATHIEDFGSILVVYIM